MSWEGFTLTVKKILTNPAWASVLVAIVAVVVTIIIHLLTSKPQNPPRDNKVFVYSTNTKNLTDFPNTVAARTRILIDGKDEKDVRFDEYIVDYQGDHPVRVTDFEAPIRGTVPENRKILAVQQSQGPPSILSTPTRIDRSGHVQRVTDAPITCDIQVTDQGHFEIRPMLMNPDDWFRVEIYSAAAGADAQASKSRGGDSPKEKNLAQSGHSEITWSCRIAGVKCPADRDLVALLDAELNVGSNSSDPLDASISEYSGWSVYFIVLFTISNLILILLLSKRTGLVRARPATQLVLFAFVVFLSMATSEILADWWFNDNSLRHQPTASSVLLSIDIALLVSLFIMAIAKRIKDSPASD